MKKVFTVIAILATLNTQTFAQEKKEGKDEMKSKVTVPSTVKTSFSRKYPNASKVTWEKENGNYEANWGGKSGEDNSAQFTSAGDFIEIVNAISVSELPSPVIKYVKENYNGSRITEAGKVTDAKGKLTYEAEVNRKDIIFDEKGNFVKKGN